MTLPYRLALGCLLLGLVAFGLSPWLTLHSIERAARENDIERWPSLIREDGLREFAGDMLEAMLDLKLGAQMKQNPSRAKRDHLAAQEHVPQTAKKLADPRGFSHLLCGKLSGDPHEVMHIESGCWALNGRLNWESPTRVRVTFKNPETDWHSSLILERNGLFSWRAVAVELPVGAILERFAEAEGLKPRKFNNA